MVAEVENPPLETHWVCTDRGVADVLGFVRDHGPVSYRMVIARYELTPNAARRLMKTLHAHGVITAMPGGWCSQDADFGTPIPVPR